MKLTVTILIINLLIPLPAPANDNVRPDSGQIRAWGDPFMKVSIISSSVRPNET